MWKRATQMKFPATPGNAVGLTLDWRSCIDELIIAFAYLDPFPGKKLVTIAACYLSGDGVVFGADSTTTMFVASAGPNAGGAEHHFNFGQKIFQIGADSTLGITMWGLGNLDGTSYRTLIAQFADQLVGQPASTMQEVAERWNRFFWAAYAREVAPFLQRTQQLLGQPSRTPDEDRELEWILRSFSGGFCLGGNLLHDRTPFAFEITYAPNQTAPVGIQPLRIGTPRFWGVPNIMERLLYGIDQGVFDAIVASGRFNGSRQDLFNLAQPHFLGQPHHLAIREAIDWIHASIHTTIKALKFSHLPPWCGGPVEVAVITTDRPFRWVRHKKLDSAISQSGYTDA